MSNKKQVIHNIRTEVDSFGRKKYKLEQVVHSDQQQSEDDHKNNIDTGRHKSMLIARQQSLNIEKYIGRIDTNKKKKVTEVFYCDVCQEGFKCDMAYLTHINSPAHNRKLGMNMKVKAVSLESVAFKLNSLKQKKQSKAIEFNKNESTKKQNKQQKKQDKQKNYQANNKNDQDQQVQYDNDGLAELEMMKSLGLPTAFGSKKNKR